VAAVLGSVTAITVYGLEADWARYHLPVLLLQAVGIGVIAGVAGKLIGARTSGTATGPYPDREMAGY
jgi:hypothetical protein